MALAPVPRPDRTITGFSSREVGGAQAPVKPGPVKPVPASGTHGGVASGGVAKKLN
jgi:hypothetical protein